MCEMYQKDKMLSQGDIAIVEVWRNNERQWIDETAISDEE